MYSANGKAFGFPVNIQVPVLGQDEAEQTPMTPQTAYSPGSTSPEEIAPVASEAEAKQLVSALQQRLQAKGFDPGKIDGIYGPKTNAALNNARINAGLPEGTDRMTIMQSSALRLPYRDAARVRDAINYQTAAAARKKAAADANKDDSALVPILPDLPAAAIGLTKRWWFWGLLAVGLTGAGIATYFIIKKSRENPEPGFEPEEPEADSKDKF